MPYRFTFDANHKRVAIVVSPPVSEYDAIECFRDVRAHPEFREDHGILINLLAADRPLTVTESEHLGGVMKYLFPKQKIALVRHNPTPTQAVDALRAAASSRLEIRIFAQLTTAELWLAS